MKKFCAILIGWMLVFSWGIAGVASGGEYLPEGFHTFGAEIQKKTADGTIVTEQISPVNGEVWLQRGAEDLIAQMYAEFEPVQNGVVRLSCDIYTELPKGNLLSLSGELFSEGISLYSEQETLFLVTKEDRFEAGSFLQGQYQTVAIEIHYDEKKISLWVDGDLRLNDVAFSGYPVSCASVMLLGDTVGSVSWKDLSLTGENGRALLFSDIDTNAAKASILRMANAGYLEGVGNGLFQPDATVTRAQMAEMTRRLLKLPIESYEGLFSDVLEGDWFASCTEAVCRSGIMVGYEGLFRPYDAVSLEETAKIFTEIFRRLNGTIVADTVELVTLRYEKEENEDAGELVARDVQLLAGSLPTERYLFREFVLPSEGRFGSHITWQVQNGEIDAENRLTFERSVEADKELILTATVTQGDAKQEKEFRYLLYPCGVKWESIADLSDSGNLLMPTTGKLATFHFNIIPENDNMNALIGFSNRDTLATAFSQMPIIVRMNEAGHFDCYNYNAYNSDKKVSYQAGKEYNIRVVVDFLNSAYSVFVAPSGEKEVQIAKNYAFRASAGGMSSVGRCYLRFGSSAKTNVFRVSYHSLAAPEEVLDNERYPFDKRYYAKNVDTVSPLEKLQQQYYLKEDVLLPEYDAMGREYVWLSSNPAVLSDDGRLVADDTVENADVTMCAIVRGAKPATSAVLLQKENISSWAITYLLQAADIGLIQGILNQPGFDGRKPIDRAYCAVLMDRLLQVE